MTYELHYSKQARKQLKKLDPRTSGIIVQWLKKNIKGNPNPRMHGKALTGDLSGIWRYRIGNYRVLCEIQDERLVVLALQIAHRSYAYKKKYR